MKIAFILVGKGYSGGIKAPVKQAICLKQRGHDVRLLVNTHNTNIRSWLRRKWLHLRYPQGSNWVQLFDGPIEYFKDITECVFRPGEFVVAHGWWAKKEIRRIQQSNIQKIHYIHGFASEELVREAWAEPVPKIVCASYLVDEVKRVCGQKVHAVVPNGVDMEEFYSCESELLRDGIGTIYGDNYHKDPKTTLGVMASLHEQMPHVPQYIFGAAKRPAAIRDKNYRRLPSLNQIRSIYSRSLVWLLASASEGFPLPPLEAMACGCVVVATDCGGPRDYIRDGENGFLVRVGDIKQCVDRIKLVLCDIDLRQKLAGEALSTAKKFSWENSAVQLEKALLELPKVNEE